MLESKKSSAGEGPEGERELNALSPLPTRQEIIFSPVAKRWTVLILAGLLIAFVLHVAEVLPPFVWAVATAFVFNGPVKSVSTRFKWPRWGGVVLVYGLFIVTMIVGLAVLIPALINEGKTLASDRPKIESTVNDYLAKNPTISLAGIEISSDTVRTAIDSVVDRLPALAQELGPKFLSRTARILIDFLLYLIATLYLMLLGGRTVTYFIDTLPLAYREELRLLFSRINTVLAAYIKGQVLLVLIMSVSSFIILAILGVRYALLLGIMTGILELVPFVGPYLAITICGLVAFFQQHGPGIGFGLDGLTLAIIAGICLFILRQLEDYVVIPNLIGRIVELPPLLIVFTIVTGATLLGPIGLLLGVPIVAVLKILIGYLYYKMVDAERQKVFLPPDTGPEELYRLLQKQPAGSRLLLVLTGPAEFLRDPMTLAEFKRMSEGRQVDLAFYCGEDEKTGNQIRQAGFPLITLSQEQFATGTR